MKKVALGFIIIFVGLGIVSIPSVIPWLSIGDPSEEIGNVSVDEGPGLLEKSFEAKKENPKKDKKDTITATINFNPNKLNCKSKGRWVTVYIGLPSPHMAEDIDISTIVLTTSINQIGTSQTFPHTIVDINGDNVPELMIKFDRSALIEILEQQQLCEITVTGKLYDGVKFEGSYIIKLIHYS